MADPTKDQDQKEEKQKAVVSPTHKQTTLPSGAKVSLQLPAKGILENIGTIQEVISLLETLATADVNANGSPDWKDMVNLGKAAAAAIVAFKAKLPALNLGNIAQESQAFFAILHDYYSQADTIVEGDFKAFQAKYPQLLGSL